jgi:hypothetical protein
MPKPLPASMAFAKAFPRRQEKSPFPAWEEIELDDEEEKQAEKDARLDNIRLMLESVEDAKAIMDKKGLKDYQTDLVNIAIALFEKRASHAVFWKEKKTKEKFDKKFKQQKKE